MGIGFPPLTGGAAQFMQGYEASRPADRAAGFVARADELADTYGERFRPTAYLRELAEKGERLPRLTRPDRRGRPPGYGPGRASCRTPWSPC